MRTGLALVELPGRFQIVPGQPTLVLDVAHNPHAVAALALNLDQMGFYPRTHAVFGAMRDKDLAGVRGAHRAAGRRAGTCTDLPTAARRRRADELAQPCAPRGARRRVQHAMPTPRDALRAALERGGPR